MTWTISKALMKDYENSHCLQVQGVESLGANCSDGIQSVPLNLKNTPETSLYHDKMTGACRHSRYGTTCEHLTESHGAELLMWFRAGSPAKILAQPEKAQESKVSAVGYGQKWRGLLVKYDQSTHGWRTHHCLFNEGLQDASVILPKWGMMQNGALLERITQDYRIIENVAGYSLIFPTTRTSMYKNRKWWARKDGYRSQLEEIATLTDFHDLAGKQINPQWLEHLMGWVVGWSDLKPLETGKYHKP